MTDKGPDLTPDAAAPVVPPANPTNPTSPASAASGPGGVAGSAASSGQGDGGHWTDQVTDLIVDSVDKVRDRTTGPALKAARAVVYGVLIVIVGIPAGVLLCIGTVRALDYFIPGDVWIVYAGMGSFMVLVGSILWANRGSARLT